MKDLFEGMYKFTAACTLKGVIKPLPAENSLKLIYEARFSVLEKVPVPNFISFERFKATYD